MKLTGGFTVGSLKHTGHMPKLIVGDGSDFRQRPSAR